MSGKNGLDRIISSVSVLETFAENQTFKEFSQSFSLNDDALILSGLVSLADNVDLQCKCLQTLNQIGEVGLVLYYVGIYLPEIDQRLIQLADQLDFPLICMPKNRIDLRYSEAIDEVMELVINDRKKQVSFVGEFLDRLASVPEQQRNMERLLKMISTRIHASIFLFDHNQHLLDAVSWPYEWPITEEELLRLNSLTSINNQRITWQDQQNYYLTKLQVSSDQFPFINVLIIKESLLSKEQQQQTAEIIQLFLTIWHQSYGQNAISELIRAIINDETFKMRQIAKTIHVDIASIQSMGIFSAKKVSIGQQRFTDLLKELNAFMRETYPTPIVDVFDDTILFFFDDHLTEKMLQEFLDQLKTEGLLDDQLFCVTRYQLTSPREVRNSYLLILKLLAGLKKVFPHKSQFSYQEVLFVKICQEAIQTGEENLQQVLQPLELLDIDERTEELLETLAVYLLDCQNSLVETAECLFLHKNTVSYRIQQLSQKLHFSLNNLADIYPIYRALAVKRLLK